MARSITRELAAVTSQVQGISMWRAEVDMDRSENKKEMAIVNRKLDQLLEAILQPGGIRGVREVDHDESAPTSSPSDQTASNVKKSKTVTPPPGWGTYERTCSASYVSEDTFVEAPAMSFLGTSSNTPCILVCSSTDM